jgi:nitroreductase
MELIDAIKARRSIRKFRDDPVPDEIIDELLEAGRLAPSGSNLQPWRFIIVKSEEAKRELEGVTPYRFAVRAPVLFVCCADLTASGMRDKRITELIESGAFTAVDMDDPNSGKYGRSLSESISVKGYLSLNVAIAIEHIVLRATDLGLGSCWIGRFDQEKTKKILGLGDDIFVVLLLPIGYPAQEPAQRPRLPAKNIVLKTL